MDNLKLGELDFGVELLELSRMLEVPRPVSKSKIDMALWWSNIEKNLDRDEINMAIEFFGVGRYNFMKDDIA